MFGFKWESTLDKDDEAKGYFEQAIEIDKDYYPAYLGLTDCIGLSNRTEYLRWLQRTEQLFDKLLAKSTKDEGYGELCWRYYWFRFINYALLENVDALFKAIDRAREGGFDDSTAFEDWVQGRLGQMMEALSDTKSMELLQKAVKQDPNNVQCRGTLAGVQIMKIFSGFIELYSDSAESKPEIMPSRLHAFTRKKGTLYWSTKRHLDWIIKTWGQTFPAAYFYLGELEMMRGNLKTAEAHIKKAIALAPERSKYYSALCGLYFLDGGEWEENDLKQFLNLLEGKCTNSPTGDDCYRIGVLHFHMGDYIQSKKEFSSALAVDPGHASSRIAFATALLAQGYLKEARGVVTPLRNSEEFLGNLEPDQRSYLYLTLGVLSLVDHDRLSGKRWLRKAVEAYEGNDGARGLLWRLEQ